MIIVSMHAPFQTHRQMDRRTNIMAIVRRFVLTNAARAENVNTQMLTNESNYSRSYATAYNTCLQRFTQQQKYTINSRLPQSCRERLNCICCAIFSSGGGSSMSIHRVSQQQYNIGNGHRLGRLSCRVKPTSAERSLEVAAARKQVNRAAS